MPFLRRKRSKQVEMPGQTELFPVADFEGPERVELKPLEGQLWTQSKAALVARYLHYFVFITHHGTYIDAFAGPQSEEDVPENEETLSDTGWTAQRVLQNEPAWLNKFFLFDINEHQIRRLELLRDEYHERPIFVTDGDVNRTLSTTLPPGSLRDKEAAFCLVDQRTFECEWETVKYVAGLKPSDRKVELFYFLAQGWLDRSFAASTTPEGIARVDRWWGSPEWTTSMRGVTSAVRARTIEERFRSELGYAFSTAWPIYDRAKGGRIMYSMVHASDHPEAPKLMRRAYDWAVRPVPEDAEQLALDFAPIKGEFEGTYEEA